MGLFGKETDEKRVKRLAAHAGGIIEMLKDAFRTEKGTDLFPVLVFSASLAGMACHEAVKASKGTFAVAEDKQGRKYWFGDDLNRYLLENRTSVAGFCTAVVPLNPEEIPAMAAAFVSSIGTGEMTVCGFRAEELWQRVHECWEGIYDNMTARFCRSPEDWPVLYGIVLQNILLQAIQAGAPREEACRTALVSAIAVSKMDRDSFLQ